MVITASLDTLKNCTLHLTLKNDNHLGLRKHESSHHDAIENFEDTTPFLLKLKKYKSQSSNIQQLGPGEIACECYISVQKLMRSELKAFDTRDSFVFRNSLSMSRRMSGHSLDVTSFQDQSTSGRSPDPILLRDLFLHPKSQIKKFQERVTVSGKVVGKIKGTFRIANIPMLQQMTVGILTEKGIQMVKAPILMMEQNESHGLFSLFKVKDNRHP